MNATVAIVRVTGPEIVLRSGLAFVDQAADEDLLVLGVEGGMYCLCSGIFFC